MPPAQAMLRADKVTETLTIDLLLTDLKITSNCRKLHQVAIISPLRRNFKKVQLNNASNRTKWRTH